VNLTNLKNREAELVVKLILFQLLDLPDFSHVLPL
jgi:hypothetical protein